MTASADQRLVLIESGSNQSWIFQSTKRKFQVGASALIKQLPIWVSEAVADHAAETLVSTSSRAILLVDSAATGKLIISAVTKRCLREAPGLDVWGVVEEPDSLSLSVSERLALLQSRHETWRWQRVGPLVRAPMGPFSQQCAATTWPAEVLTAAAGGSNGLLAVAQITKRAFAQAEQARKIWGDTYHLPEAALIAKPEDEVSNDGWVAVIHADGNGVGGILDRIETFEDYHVFSEALAEASAKAFRQAVEQTNELAQAQSRPIEGWLIPLIVGGDDLTVVCDARFAVPFTRHYLEAFRQATTDKRLLIDAELKEAGHLSAAAGIAVVKPHYPFHAAYELVDELVASAKQAKQYAPGASSYDLHVLHDSIARPLDEIRSGRVGALVCAPLVISELNQLAADCTVAEHYAWWHRDTGLLEQAQQLAAQVADETVSGKALHELRAAGLESEAAMQRILGRLAVTNPEIIVLIREQLTRDSEDGEVVAILTLLDLMAISLVPTKAVMS